MKYAAIIREAASTLDGDCSLADLLARVDAIDRSVPTHAEFNDAILFLCGSISQSITAWYPVSLEAYSRALADNREAMIQLLQTQGMSSDQQESILKWHASFWQKPGA